jgi:hypothetical protein
VILFKGLCDSFIHFTQFKVNQSAFTLLYLCITLCTPTTAIYYYQRFLLHHNPLPIKHSSLLPPCLFPCPSLTPVFTTRVLQSLISIADLVAHDIRIHNSTEVHEYHYHYRHQGASAAMNQAISHLQNAVLATIDGIVRFFGLADLWEGVRRTCHNSQRARSRVGSRSRKIGVAWC